MHPLMSPRFGTAALVENANRLQRENGSLGALNDYEDEISHSILSRRNVETMTFLQEEHTHPSYERNEDDAFVSSSKPHSAQMTN